MATTRKRKETKPKKTGAKNKGGRPASKPTDKIDPALVALIAAQGFTEKEIAAALEVTDRTLRLWKKKDAKFFSALQAGKDIADKGVEESLYKRAVGYYHPELTLVRKGRGKSATVRLEKTVIKHYPGDVGAMQFWLTNRQPDKWRHTKQVDVTSGGKELQTKTYIVPAINHAVDHVDPEQMPAQVV